MKVSRSSRLDLLKHQQPAAKGISARVKLKLNAFSATHHHYQSKQNPIWSRAFCDKGPRLPLSQRLSWGPMYLYSQFAFVLVDCLIHSSGSLRRASISSRCAGASLLRSVCGRAGSARSCLRSPPGYTAGFDSGFGARLPAIPPFAFQ